ncbi:GTP-binding protein [Methanocella arvoryzae]|uniref:GTP-binding protein (Ras GTPase family) n=1 Tax=Methanocella arvoryzae (strain DSM 22066 / NBRC 105507 / MRE50) TaxID=351160 RepID=Q0W5U8_METAR|nr:GTP-binding protein [Methanocella arvoryzae]CAJ36245.1 putative GTP-binding protein (Ras GTPase family) [Methanocella arvoryzae MRE50]
MFEHHATRVSVRDRENRVKVVAFGSYHSGKTSLIRSIDPLTRTTEAYNPEGGTTVALDFGIREHRGYKIFIYGTPGQDRFGVARAVVSFGLHAGIVVVDSVRGMTSFEKKILAELTEHNVPCVVLASKIDLPGASVDRVRRDSGNACVLPFSAATGQGVDELLDRLADIASTMA